MEKQQAKKIMKQTIKENYRSIDQCRTPTHEHSIDDLLSIRAAPFEFYYSSMNGVIHRFAEYWIIHKDGSVVQLENTTDFGSTETDFEQHYAEGVRYQINTLKKEVVAGFAVYKHRDDFQNINKTNTVLFMN